MVRRLVEQQQVRLRDERAGEQHAPAPAARQFVDARVGREAEAREHQLHALLDAPAVLLLQLVLKPAEPFQPRVGRLLGDLDRRAVVGRHQVAQVVEPFGDHVEHRAGGGARRER